jgi:hypothetical protein
VTERADVIVWPGVSSRKRARRRALRVWGVFATVVGASMLAWAAMAPVAHSATSLAAEPGQTPMPSGVTPVPEDCKGIAPTPGSKNDTTQKQLNEGQGIVNVGPNSFDPGGTVHFIVLYNATNKSASFDIRDCVVVFLPGNPNIADVLALVDPADHGQIIPTPGSTPAVKGFDGVIDSGQFEFPDNVALPGEFDFSWTVPADAPPGALICNYAKDTGGSNVGGKENRKGGGACFTVPTPPQTTTTTTANPTTTTTTSASTTTTIGPTTTTAGATPGGATTTTTTAATTTTTTTAATTTTTGTEPSTTTSPAATAAATSATSTTTIPTAVLGESFTKSPLAFTGAETARMVAIGGVLLVTGGLLLLVNARREEAQALTRR